MTRWQKIGIGVTVIAAIVVGLGFWARTELKAFFYPVAPPMPAVVGETMPEVLAHLESVL